MPRPKPEIERKGVLLRLSDEAIAALDRRRGDMSRSAYVENMLDGPAAKIMDQAVATQIAVQEIFDPPKRRLSTKGLKGFDPKTGEPIYE